MNPQSFNRYAYALNNPATFNDPLGLAPHCSGGGDNCKAYGEWYGRSYALHQTFCGIYGCPKFNYQEFNLAFLSGVDENGGFWTRIDPGGFLVASSGLFGARAPFGVVDTPASLGPPRQTNATQTNACTEPILSAVNNQFGSGTYTVTNTFPWGGATNLQITATDLAASQFNALQTGRYPLHWWSYIIGYGPTLHVTGQTLSDPVAYFSNTNVGGVTSVDFTAHLDSAFAYNPIGALIHWLVDVRHIFGPRNHCP